MDLHWPSQNNAHSQGTAQDQSLSPKQRHWRPTKNNVHVRENSNFLRKKPQSLENHLVPLKNQYFVFAVFYRIKLIWYFIIINVPRFHCKSQPKSVIWSNRKVFYISVYLEIATINCSHLKYQLGHSDPETAASFSQECTVKIERLRLYFSSLILQPWTSEVFDSKAPEEWK